MICLLLLAAVLFVQAVLGSPAWAQREPHGPVPGGDALDFRRLLRERMGQRKLQEKAVGDLLKDLRGTFDKLGLDPAQLKNLENNPLLQDPRLRDYLKGLMEMSRDPNGVPPETLQQLQQQLSRLSNARTPADLPRLPDPITPLNPPPRGGEQPPAPVAPPPPTPDNAPGTPVLLPEAPEQKTADSIGKWMREFASKSDNWPQSLRDSPTLKNLMRDLLRSDGSGVRGETLAKELARWNGYLRGAQNAVRESRSAMNWKWPSWSSDPLPRMGRPNLAAGVPTLPSMSIDQWQIIAMLLLLSLIGVLVYLAWSRHTAEAAARAGIGPWPIDPRRITTPQQLIVAFEYLGVAIAGPAARSWHHQAIATAIAGDDATLRSRAASLADAYAWARYAPNDLPPERLAPAVRSLCDLAGVTHS